MSDPRNVAHDKKVAQGKKHDGIDVTQEDAPAARPGQKSAGANPKPVSAEAAASSDDTAAGDGALPSATAAHTPPATLERSLEVLAKLKDLEFHSRAHIQRLAELTLTVEDELKQKEIVGSLGEVYSAQNAVETKLTVLIEAYKAECDRLQGAQ